MRGRLFLFFAKTTCRYPALVLSLWVIAAAGSLVLASQLEMLTGRTDLLSPDNRHVRAYTNFTYEFGTANNIYFIIESPSLRKSKLCANTLAAEIEKHPRYIRDVLYRVDLDAVESKLFLHLSEEQLQAVERYLQENEGFLEQAVEAKSLGDLFPVIGDLAEKRARNKFRNPAAERELRALAGLLEGMNSYLWGQEHSGINFLPAVAAGALPFGVSDDPDGYLVGKNKETVVVVARPNAEKEDSLDFLKPMMAVLMQARANALQQFPGVTIGVTGLPTFAYGDLRVMQEEMPLLFILALIAAALLFYLFFRHPLEIAFAGISLLMALACTLGAARLLIGHLNIISSVFAITLVSLGIDFGIHFISRFHTELAERGQFEDAVEATLLGAGPPITTGALTTAAAFYILVFTDFRGLAELGVIAGTGIILCLLSMLTAIPSMLAIQNRLRPLSPATRGRTEVFLDRVIGGSAAAASGRAGAIVAAASAGTLLMLFLAPQLSFDYNFLHIQPKSSTTGDYEEVLMERTGLAPSFNVIVEDDLRSLEQKVERLREFPSVARVDSATDLLPVGQTGKMHAVESILGYLTAIRRHLNRKHEAESLSVIVEQFELMRRGLTRALELRGLIDDKEIVRQLERTRKAADVFLSHYRSTDRKMLSEHLQEFSRDFFSYLEGQTAILSDGRQLEEVKLSDYPRSISTRFIGRSNKYAAYAFPSQSVWNKDFLDKFNEDTLSVAPNAAGTTLFAQELLEIAGRAVRQSALLVFFAISGLVFFDFRKAAPTVLSLLSVVLGLIWMLGIMKILGWQYNPIDIMAIPVMLGIGIDNGVHIVHRYLDSGRDIAATLRTSGRAVAVSSLTTIAGFACLLLSTHRGLISLAQLLVLGMSTCLVAALFVLPALLHSIAKK